MNAQQAGKLMQGHRRRRKLTQDDVVNAGAVSSAQYLSQLENGKYDIRNSEFFRPLAALYRLTPDQVREIVPDAVLEFNGGQLTPTPTDGPTVLIPPNLEQALSILAAEDPAYAERRFAEKLAMIDPEDGDADPPVSEWVELAKAIMRIRKKRRG